MSKRFHGSKSLIGLILLVLLVIAGVYLFTGAMMSGRFGGGMMMGGRFSGGAYNGSGPEGYRLFNTSGCIRCHTINGRGGTIGPDLSRVGSKRSFSWIVTQIAAPSTHFKRGSTATINGKTYPVIMPNYERMPKSEVITISRYLESLK